MNNAANSSAVSVVMLLVRQKTACDVSAAAMFYGFLQHA